MVAPQGRPKRVDRWTLRCRFNRARYRERVAANELTMTVKRKSVTRKPNDPDPLPDNIKFTCEWTYRDPRAHDHKIADGHFYERNDGSTTDHDPKHLEVDGQRYALYEGTGLIHVA